MTKVIHVHLIYEKKNYYFGSISAIFDVLTEEEVGITKNSLLHAGMTDGSCKITKRAMIIQSHLIRSGKWYADIKKCDIFCTNGFVTKMSHFLSHFFSVTFSVPLVFVGRFIWGLSLIRVILVRKTRTARLNMSEQSR